MKAQRKKEKIGSARKLFFFLTSRSYSVIILGALVCTLVVKFFHGLRTGILGHWPSWVLADVAILLAIDAIVTAVCYKWPRKRVIRPANLLAAVVCTYAVMNAGWVIRTGTQILPDVLVPLFRAPINSLVIVGHNLYKMPAAAAAILVPSFFALVFFFYSLAKARRPGYSPVGVKVKIIAVMLLAGASGAGWLRWSAPAPANTVSSEMNYNCHLKAVAVLTRPSRMAMGEDHAAGRVIPAAKDFEIAPRTDTSLMNHNVVIMILEGVQYHYTSLYNPDSGLTPYLLELSEQSVNYRNMRTVLTHTTKALFSLLTGRNPSVSHDIAETVPADGPYASLATILEEHLGFRTAFYQSAKGNFEARPALVHNLGFDQFKAREDMADPNEYLGSLGSDEFTMLEHIEQFMTESDRPFLLTVMLSVTHDPYEVPGWYAEPEKKPLARYRQAIEYTDSFIRAVDEKLNKLNLNDDTILVVVGDHAEAFGEHGLFGHERIGFEEVLRVPFVLRATSLIKSAAEITEPVTSTDLTPTILALLGFDTRRADFDGRNTLSQLPRDRRLYFSGWLDTGPAGFVQARMKRIYNSASDNVTMYDLTADPLELTTIEPPAAKAHDIADNIIQWRKSTFFQLDPNAPKEVVLYDNWLITHEERIATAKRLQKED